MRRALAMLATVAAVGATMVTAPAEARGRFKNGLFGMAAGNVGPRVWGAYGPYYSSSPSYGYYYPPLYYGPAYAYVGSPYFRQHYWRHYW